MMAHLLLVALALAGEPAVTTRLADAQTLAIGGTQATARILVEGGPKASLTFVEIPSGSRWMRPSSTGTAVVYVVKGRAKVGPGAVTEGDVIVFTEGSAHPVLASLRTELLVLLAPPGGEQAYRGGAVLGTAGTGPEPRIVKRASGQKHPILGGKGEVALLVEKDKASVSTLRVDDGATVPEHAHAAEAEILYVLQGKGEMVVGGKTYPIEPFMAVHLPPGARHGFTAASRVQAIQFYAPSGPEQRFKGTK